LNLGEHPGKSRQKTRQWGGEKFSLHCFFGSSKVAKLTLRPFFSAALAMLFFWPLGIATSQAWEMRVCADPNATPFSDADQPGFENRIAA